MKLTYLRSARSFYVFSFAFAIGMTGIASQPSTPQQFEMLALCARLFGGALALCACSKLVMDARVLISKWEIERIRTYDVILCSLLFVNFVLGGILFGSLFASGRF